MWCRRVEPALCFLTDSSKELEELRSAFARALEHLKQEVEERKCVLLPPRPCFLVWSWGLFRPRRFASLLFSLLLMFIHLPVLDLSCNMLCCAMC